MPYRRIGFSDRLSTTVKDVSGNLADPGALLLKIKDPANVVTTHNWTGDITRDSLGQFHYDLASLTTLGRYSYKWNSTGANLGVSPNPRYFTLVDEWTPILLTLDEAKSLTNTTLPDPDIELFIDSVTEFMEKKLGPIVPRAVLAQPAAMYSDGRLWLRKHNYVVPGSITAATQNGVSVSTTGWTVELNVAGEGTGAVVLPASTYLSGTITVSYTAGFDPIPSSLKDAAGKRLEQAYDWQRGGSGGFRVGGGSPDFAGAEGAASSFPLLLDAQRIESLYEIPSVA